MTVLMIAEHDHKNLKLANLHVISAAKLLAEQIDILIIGENCQAVAEQAAEVEGINKVIVVDHAVYAAQLAENCAKVIAGIAGDYEYILSGAGTFGKNLLPRVAALLDVNMISDITKVVSTDTFERPIYAGNVLATVQSTGTKKVISIRATAFPEAKKSSSKATIEKIDTVIENDLTEFVNQELTISSRPELTNAKVVISGGRGLKSAENFKLLERLADQLNAAIGASRAAVDAGFAPNDYQVGQTGKIVAPELYIAIGISGAIQHLAGMKDSKIIVAINNDPEAQIFEEADYGIVGDLFKILPELEAELQKVAAA